MNKRFQTRQQNSIIVYISLIDTRNESKGTSAKMEISVLYNTVSLMNILEPQNFNKIPDSLEFYSGNKNKIFIHGAETASHNFIINPLSTTPC